MANSWFFVCPRGMLLEAHSMDAFVDVFSGHYLVDDMSPLVPILLCWSHSSGRKLCKCFFGEKNLKVVYLTTLA